MASMATPYSKYVNTIQILSDEPSKHTEYSFTLKGVDTSIANALRRTMLSDIETVVFRTAPYAANMCTIHANTSRSNNEILKHRLSCIPIHIDPRKKEYNLSTLQLELQVENSTDDVLFVTTDDFSIRDLSMDRLLPKEEVRKIFPADDITGDFIDFARLRPRIGDLAGEKIHLTCLFDIATPKEDSCYSVVSTCSYRFSPDATRQDAEAAKKTASLQQAGKTAEEVDFEMANWKLLEAQRFFVEHSFDFVIESVGVYTNKEVVLIACQVLIHRLKSLMVLIDENKLAIKEAEVTIPNCYDIVLEGEDYTLGKVIEYFLYEEYFVHEKTLSFCGFKKTHPHDSFSTLRLGYKETIVADRKVVSSYLQTAIVAAGEVFHQIFTLLSARM